MAAVIRPFAAIGFAEDDGAGRAQPGGDAGIARDFLTDEREGAGRRLHPIRRVDVVLQQDRYAV